MKREEKEKILETIRKEHGIAIDKNDPLFALITANEIMLERQIKEQAQQFKEQLIDMEMVTTRYLTQSKELLEKKLTKILKEAKTQLDENNKQTRVEIKEKNRNHLTHPTLFVITGIIIGYTIALFIL